MMGVYMRSHIPKPTLDDMSSAEGWFLYLHTFTSLKSTRISITDKSMLEQ